MVSMMSDPQFLDSAMSMMRGMDEESLTSMMISSGMCASKDQAHAMAKQVGAVHGSGYYCSCHSCGISPVGSPG